jgi:hypothetical protein
MVFFLVLNIIFCTLYIICRIQFLRFFLYIYWFVFSFIIIGLFDNSFLFGYLSALSYDSKFVFNFIFSNENLLGKKYLINDSNTADVLNICLNYGGDLGSELLNIKNTDMIYMDNIYKYSHEIMDINFNLSKTSSGIKNLLNYYNDLLKNINLVKGQDNDLTVSPKYLLDELRKFTDFYVEGSYQFNCQTILKDAWVINKESCPDNYILENKDIKDNTSKGNFCHLISLWTEEDLSKRYKDKPWDCGDKKSNELVIDKDFPNFPTAILGYWNSLKRYDVWHREIIRKIIEDLNIIYNDALKIEQEMNNQIILVENYTRQFYNLFKPYVGNSDIFALINCCKKNLKKILKFLLNFYY